jgi:hypothetical protein
MESIAVTGIYLKYEQQEERIKEQFNEEQIIVTLLMLYLVT